MENLWMPNLQSQIGRRNPTYPLVTPIWVGGPTPITGKHWGPGGWWATIISGGPLPGGSSQETKCTPQGSTSDPLGKSSGKQWPQCGWPEGHLSERERVGTQRTISLTPSPTQPDEDMGHPINTLATSLQLGTPHINTFSGKAMQGKMELSFKQWYHEVQCMKDHYPESVVCESIMQSLKGAVADMARYMGPTTSVAHILQKLTVIFRTVVSFDVLMQNFYKVIQSNHENVPFFAMRLEGTLYQIRLQCPGRITDQEMQQHLKDCLCHRVHEHIRDLICYLYSNPRTTYFQLMIAAHKAESKNEEAHHKVRPRPAVTTKPVEGTKELENQIAKLMAALTRAGQGTSPSTTPNSHRQRGCGRGWMDRNTPSCPAPTMVKLAWDGLPQPTAYLLVIVQGSQVKARDRMPNDLKITREALQIGRTPVPSNASGTKVGPHDLGMCHPSRL